MGYVLVIINPEGKMRCARTHDTFIPSHVLNPGDVGLVVPITDFQMNYAIDMPQIPPGGWL